MVGKEPATASGYDVVAQPGRYSKVAMRASETVHGGGLAWGCKTVLGWPRAALDKDSTAGL
ncbi:beta-hexosaminidase [Sesbania bispinosa]|nr:beta-hexosaminidase [Sesbania bispinosa]